MQRRRRRRPATRQRRVGGHKAPRSGAARLAGNKPGAIPKRTTRAQRHTLVRRRRRRRRLPYVNSTALHACSSSRCLLLLLPLLLRGTQACHDFVRKAQLLSCVDQVTLGGLGGEAQRGILLGQVGKHLLLRLRVTLQVSHGLQDGGDAAGCVPERVLLWRKQRAYRPGRRHEGATGCSRVGGRHVQHSSHGEGLFTNTGATSSPTPSFFSGGLPCQVCRPCRVRRCCRTSSAGLSGTTTVVADAVGHFDGAATDRARRSYQPSQHAPKKQQGSQPG